MNDHTPDSRINKHSMQRMPAFRALAAVRRAPGRSNTMSSAAANPPQQQQLFSQDVIQALVSARRRLLVGTGATRVPIRGVSFEDRGQILQQLCSGDPILAVKDPSNPFDPNAVVLTAVSGHQLGFVPREVAPHVTTEVSFGRLDSWGAVAGKPGQVGGHVLLPLKLQWPTVDLLPTSGWEGAQQLQQAQRSSAWHTLDRRATQSPVSPASPQASPRCVFTGLDSTQVPLAASPVWRFDARQQKVQLLGLQPAAQAIAVARKLDTSLPREQQEQALGLLMQMYGWGQVETPSMLAYMRTVQSRMEVVRQQQWQLDLSVLEAASAASA